MLSKDPQDWWKEISIAEQERDSHMGAIKGMVRRGHGPAFRAQSDGKDDMEALENHYHMLASALLPELVIDNPRVKADSHLRMLHEEDPETGISEQEAFESACNRWTRDEFMDEVLLDFANDGIYFQGCLHVSQEELKVSAATRKQMGLKEGQRPMKPKMRALEPDMVFWDAGATDIRDVRFMGHKYPMDWDDLMEMAKEEGEGKGWNLDAIKDLKNEAGTKDKGSDKHPELDRQQVMVYEIHVPEWEVEDSPGPDKGFHGALLTLAYGGSGDGAKKAVFLRDPQPFFGPEFGCYFPWGAHPVMGDTYKASPLVIIEQQAKNLNDLVRAFSLAARKAKSGVAVTGMAGDVAEALKEFEQSGVFKVDAVEDLRSAFSEFTIGGPPDGLAEFILTERDRLERVSGLPDVRRGSTSSGASATEVALADSAASKRVDALKKAYQRAVNKAFRAVAWYMLQDERSRYVLMPDTVERMTPGTEVNWWMPPTPTIPFEAWDLEIEAYSMSRENEGLHQKRLLEFMGVYLQMVPLAIQAPDAAPWGDMAEDLAKALNLPRIQVKLNEQGLRAANAQLAQGAQPGGKGGAGQVAGVGMQALPGQQMGAMFGSGMGMGA